jgi:hypothetical protein
MSRSIEGSDFFESDTSLKIRFFQKACPEVLRDRIFFNLKKNGVPDFIQEQVFKILVQRLSDIIVPFAATLI